MLPFQYISCTLPTTVHEFSSSTFISKVQIDLSILVYKGLSQHMAHLVDEPINDDVENASNGDVIDNDEGLGEDSDDDRERVVESTSSYFFPDYSYRSRVLHGPSSTREITSSLNTQIEDTLVRASLSAATYSKWVLITNMDLPSYMATSQVNTNGYNNIVSK